MSLSQEPRVIEPRVHSDARGSFVETFRASEVVVITGRDGGFVQENLSMSRRGVLRGLHYQVPPREQGKLVQAVCGLVYDVAVDIRRSSQGFGKWSGVELSADNRKQFWIPPGFAHGFVALSETATVLYQVSEYYSPDHDRSIRWDDPDIGIDWPLEAAPVLSEKDASAPYLRDAELFA